MYKSWLGTWKGKLTHVLGYVDHVTARLVSRWPGLWICLGIVVGLAALAPASLKIVEAQGTFRFDTSGNLLIAASGTSAQHQGNFHFDSSGNLLVNCTGCGGGGSTPRLDQILDPTADKTFEMDSKTLEFHNVFTTAPGPVPFEFRSDFNNDGVNTAGDAVVLVDAHVDPSGDNHNSNFRAMDLVISIPSAATLRVGEIVGLNIDVTDESNLGTSFPAAIAATVSSREDNDTVVGAFLNAQNLAPAVSSTLIGLEIGTRNSAAAVAAIGIQIDSHQNLGTGTAEGYGIRIADQTAAVTNWAIKTGLGQVTFGDQMSSQGIQEAIRTLTSSDNATVNDFAVRCDATAGNVTLTLLASPPTGQIVNLKKVDASGNSCILAGNGHNIDGAASSTITTQFVNKQVTYDATSGTWNVL